MDKKYLNTPLAIKADCVGIFDCEVEDSGLEALEQNGWEFVNVRGGLDRYDYDYIREDLIDYEGNGNSVCFLFNSNGGDTSGLLSLANQIRDYRFTTLAYIDGSCCSAAYMLASACDKIIATESSEIGSIGVIAMLADVSAMDKENGIEFKVIRSREAKALYNPHEKLSNATIDSITAKLAEFDSIFYDFVKSSRSINDMSAIENLNGGTVLAKEAVNLGLCDDTVEYFNKYWNEKMAQTNSSKTIELTDTVAQLQPDSITAITQAGERERVLGIMEVGQKLKMSTNAVANSIKRGDSIELAASIFLEIREQLDSTLTASVDMRSSTVPSPATPAVATGGGEKFIANGLLSIDDILASIS